MKRVFMGFSFSCHKRGEKAQKMVFLAQAEFSKELLFSPVCKARHAKCVCRGKRANSLPTPLRGSMKFSFNKKGFHIWHV